MESIDHDTMHDDTVEIQNPRTFAELFFAPNQRRFRIVPAAASHRGNVRQRNEDHFAVIRNRESRELLLTNLPNENFTFPEDESYGLMVADGIGGSAAGEFASQLAIKTMFDLSARATSRVMKITDLKVQEIEKRVQAYVSEIQKTLLFYSEADPMLTGMGTTWTSAHLFGTHAIVAHLGDSRAYLFRDSELDLITKDQTVAQDLEDSGIDHEQAKPYRNILTNNLGGDREHVQAEVYHFPLKPYDRLLLCTDGLTHSLESQQITEILQSIPDPQDACDRLIKLALDAGGKDNITVILCDILPN